MWVRERMGGTVKAPDQGAERTASVRRAYGELQSLTGSLYMNSHPPGLTAVGSPLFLPGVEASVLQGV